LMMAEARGRRGLRAAEEWLFTPRGGMQRATIQSGLPTLSEAVVHNRQTCFAKSRGLPVLSGKGIQAPVITGRIAGAWAQFVGPATIQSNRGAVPGWGRAAFSSPAASRFLIKDLVVRMLFV